MTPDELLNAILGEAIKALVESGASAAFIGGFSSTHGARFAKHLQIPVESPPDLKAVITEAVQQALSASPALSVSMENGKKELVRLQVLVNGRRTSVSVRKSRVEQVIQLAGTRQEGHRIVRDLAGRAPDGLKNRSGWLDSQIEAYLQLQHQVPAGAQPH